MEFKKILIIRLSSIGDIILSTPLVRAVRKKYPNAIIDFAIKQQFADLMKHNPHINNLIVVDTGKMQESNDIISAAKYDWILNIQKSNRATQLINGAAASNVTTYSKERFKRFMLIQFKWNLYKQVKPVYLRYFEAAETFGVFDDTLGTEIFFNDQDKKSVEDILSQQQVNIAQPLITLCPGAKFANKRWTEEGFIELANTLQQNHQATIVILGGPGEEILCQSIANGIKGASINLAGKLSLLESAALLKRSKVVVANDSGLMHLAQSQKTPVIAIYGPTVKEFGFYPLPSRSQVVEVALGCRPCTKMGADKCPKGHHKCMKDITAQMMYHSMKDYVN